MNPDAYKEMANTEASHWWYVARRKIISDMLRKLNISPSAKILEIGCGTGGNLEMLSQYGEISAIEKDPGAIEIAKEKHNGRYTIKQGSCPDNIPYEKKYFDIICMFDVLEHIEEDKETLVNIKNFLKDDGFLVLTVPAYQWLFGHHDEFLHHKRRYTLSAISTLTKSSGYSTFYVSYFNTLLFPLVAIVRLKEKFSKQKNAAGGKTPPVIVNKILMKIFGAEAFFLRNFNFPFGVSIIGVFKKDLL